MNSLKYLHLSLLTAYCHCCHLMSVNRLTFTVPHVFKFNLYSVPYLNKIMYWTTNLMKIVIVTVFVSVKFSVMPEFNPLNAKLNPICHLLTLLGAHPILHISRIRVNSGMLVYTVPVHLLKTFSEQYSCC